MNVARENCTNNLLRKSVTNERGERAPSPVPGTYSDVGLDAVVTKARLDDEDKRMSTSIDKAAISLFYCRRF